MTTRLVGGPFDWSMERDDDGHRTYKVKHRVEGDRTDGPYNVFNTPGLPLIGSVWSFGDDNDPWAFCVPKLSVKQEGGPVERKWVVENTFTTRRTGGKKCMDATIENPLLEPPGISGSFVKYTKEAAKDRNGIPLKSSSHERIRGQQVEFDANRPSVKIEINSATLDLPTFSEMVDTVNDAPLWGLPKRCVKLSNVSWQWNVYGTCSSYYTRVFEFDIDFDTFDRDVLDEGSKVLAGDWAEDGTWALRNIDGAPPDPDNPTHFIQYLDQSDQPSRVLLNGAGLPITDEASAYYHRVEYYPESNFLLLGIPTSF